MNKPVLPMSSLSLRLPKADRSIETYRLAASRSFPAKLQGALNRVAFSAAHVVADPLADIDPWLSAAVEKAGGRIILMASRALAKIGLDADDYAEVYNHVLGQVREPVIIHWLGDMFDPALANYWGTQNLDTAMDIAVGIINANAAKVDGVKVSLLDKQREIDMRRRLDKNVKMYTGDDFNYAELIAGDSHGFSHALLGIFDAIAPAASYALSRLAAGDARGFHDVLGPTVPLSRLADQAGLLSDPELATRRMTTYLATRGVTG